MKFICGPKQLVRYLRENRAVAAMEYAIIVGVIVVGVGGAVIAFRNDIVTAISDIGDQVDTFDVTSAT